MSIAVKRVRAAELQAERVELGLGDALDVARSILADVARDGAPAIEDYARDFGELEGGSSIVVDPRELEEARATASPGLTSLIERTRDRIATFARAQLETLTSMDTSLPDGLRAGHRCTPIDAVGCYAPGGKFTLVSSVLMTVVPARVAGVRRVVVATPRPTKEMLAAAAIAGADVVLRVGGAQSIGALAYGFEGFAPVDFICGPGNRYVTAAKKLVFGDVGVDMLAGPSEIVVAAAPDSDAELIAADLLAQAEHDVDARAILVTTSERLADDVERALAAQLVTLDTAAIAREALARNGAFVLCEDRAEVVRVCNALAPEHLEVLGAGFEAGDFVHFGALFVGAQAGEVLGDYGAGPNHVLPTASSARYRGGLSVFDFTKVSTWIEGEDEASRALDDVVALARLEGLEAHARAAERRQALGSS